MTISPYHFALAAALVLSSCGSPAQSDNDTISQSAPSQHASPDPSPKLVPEAERGEAGARNVLLAFARAVEMREVERAHDLLSTHAKATWSGGKFAALFEGLQDITVAVPDGTMEGAAGTSYYTSEATITASDADGRPVRVEGPVVLSRVNDVPGATAEQLRWKIYSIELVQTH